MLDNETTIFYFYMIFAIHVIAKLCLPIVSKHLFPDGSDFTRKMKKYSCQGDLTSVTC